MNNCTMLGRLTKDVELKYVSGNMAIGTFSIAVPREVVKQGEERQTDFFNCKAFGKTGEFISKFFSKGKMILVNGRFQNNNYKDQQGVMHYNNEFIVNRTYFTGEKAETSNNNTSNNYQNNYQNNAQDDSLPWK